MATIQRRKTVTCAIGDVRVGSDAPVVVQSMTNTDTADIASTVQQCAALARAGSELVRVTVNNEDAAAAVAPIVEQLDKQGVRAPIIGDFHYNGHILLKKFPECARALAKYRINPGNVSVGRKNDDNFRTMIEVAVENQKPVRIGVNWGSLDQALLTRMMDENSRLDEPKDAREVTMEAMVVSALNSAALAEKYGLRPDQIILSAKVSGVQDLIDVYRSLAARCNYPLHLGLTEAGMGAKGIVASSAALGVAAAGRHRRYHSGFADASAGRRPNRRSACGAADFAVHGDSQFYAAGDGLSGMRAHHEHVLPGNGAADSVLLARADAGVERTLHGRRRNESRGDGLRGERPGRVESMPAWAFLCRERLKSRKLRFTWTDACSPRLRATRLSPSSSRFSMSTWIRTTRRGKKWLHGSLPAAFASL